MRVFYSRALSLASPREALLDQIGEEQKSCWRYRYEWLEKPENVLVALRALRERFWYSVIYRGTVQDKLLREEAKLHKEAFRASETHILNRIQEDQKKMPEAFAVDRSLWKQRAMDLQAKVHEQNWAQGKIDDPLGLALFLNTGVSLGLRFDQDRTLSEGETLSNRRLQTRAVKSVIKRTQHIYSDTMEKVRALDTTDPVEKDRRLRDIRSRSDAELQRLSNRLIELIPTDGDLKGVRVEMFTSPIELKKISKNNYVVERKTENADILKTWRESYFGTSPDTSSSFDVIPLSTDIETNLRYNRTDNEPSKDDGACSNNRTSTKNYIAAEDIDPSLYQERLAITRSDSDMGLTRRDAIRRSATILIAGTLIGGSTVKHEWEKLQQSSKPIANLNFTRVFRETSIDITVDGPMNREFLNSQTFQKVQTIKLPKWVPQFLVPPPRVVRDVTNLELLTAGAIAGSVVEIVRTSLLYPLLTLKTRIQTDVNVGLRKRPKNRRRLRLRRRLQISQLKALRHIREGNLYAGIWASLLISVPATGVYFGVRDIAIRKLIPYTDALGGSISVALLAALVADVISLIVRTPADTLAIRLQSATGEEFEWEEGQDAEVTESERRYYLQEKIGNWFLESLERLPAVIVTDLPFLLSRIALNRILLQGGSVSLSRYEGIVLFSAILCSLLTTPFDVARTRILVDSDGDPTNGDDGGSGEGLVRTFRKIIEEGEGGIQNLFAGWLERVAYFGFGRAWIEPLQILGYIAIRDFILLEWF
jgi:hypothetical protein